MDPTHQKETFNKNLMSIKKLIFKSTVIAFAFLWNCTLLTASENETFIGINTLGFIDKTLGINLLQKKDRNVFCIQGGGMVNNPLKGSVFLDICHSENCEQPVNQQNSGGYISLRYGYVFAEFQQFHSFVGLSITQGFYRKNAWFAKNHDNYVYFERDIVSGYFNSVSPLLSSNYIISNKICLNLAFGFDIPLFVQNSDMIRYQVLPGTKFNEQFNSRIELNVNYKLK